MPKKSKWCARYRRVIWFVYLFEKFNLSKQCFKRPHILKPNGLHSSCFWRLRQEAQTDLHRRLDSYLNLYSETLICFLLLSWPCSSLLLFRHFYFGASLLKHLLFNYCMSNKLVNIIQTWYEFSACADTYQLITLDIFKIAQLEKIIE